MGPAANDVDRLDTMDDVDADSDVDTYDTVVIVSATEEEMDAARAQIERTRAEMGETIDAIRDRLNPEHLMQQAKDTVREATVGKAQDAANAAMGKAQDAANAAVETAKGTGMSAIEFIKENPIPAALTGIGVTWLVMNARRQNDGQRADYDSRPAYQRGPGYADYDELRPGYPDGSSAASQVIGRVGEAAGQVQDKAGQIVDQVQDKAGQVAGQMQDQMSQIGAQAQYQGQRAVDWFQRLLQENPLAVGAAAIAVGMAIGFVVPETIQESRWMGSVRDNFMQKAQQTAHNVLEDKAHQVADAVSDKVHDMAQEAVDTIG